MNKLVVRESPPDTFVELMQFDAGGGASTGILVDNADGSQTRHPWEIVDLWSDAELAAINIYRVDPAVPPEGVNVLSYHFARQNGVVVQVLETEPIPSPDPGSEQPRLVAAMLGISIANGDVSGVAGTFNVGGVLYIDIGTYWLYFATPEPDPDYIPLVVCGTALTTVAEKHQDYFVIEARGAAPDSPLADAELFDVQVFRF